VKLNDLYNSITVGINPKPQFREVMEAVNTIIRLVNSRKSDHRVLYDLKRTTGTNIEDMDETLIENLDTVNISDMGTYSDDVTYNATNYTLTVKNSALITRIEAIFVDDVLWTQENYETIKDTNNSNLYIYSMIGRVIYFPTDIGSTEKVIKVLARKMYEPIATPDDKTGEYTDMPETYYQELVSGAVYLLTTKEAIAQVNADIFRNEQNKTKSIEVGSSFIQLTCPV